MKQVYAFLSLGLLSSCLGSPEGQAERRLIPLQAEVLPAQQQVFDLGHGGGQVSLKLNFQRGEGFKTKLRCTIDDDLVSLRVFLINGNPSFGGLYPLGNVGNITSQVLPSTSSWYPVNLTLSSPSASQIVTFKNIGTGQYYIGVAAYDAPNGTGTNITSAVSGLLSGGTISGTGQVAISDSGGESGGSPSLPGRVNIGSAPGYSLLNGSSATLGITLTLAGLLGPC